MSNLQKAKIKAAYMVSLWATTIRIAHQYCLSEEQVNEWGSRLLTESLFHLFCTYIGQVWFMS